MGDSTANEAAIAFLQIRLAELEREVEALRAALGEASLALLGTYQGAS